MKTIGLFFETNGEFGREFLKGVAKYAHERGNWRLRLLQLANVTEDSFADCDGIIARVGDATTLEMLKATKLPIVDGFCQVHDEALVGVDSDHLRIGEMAAGHFLSHGFKSFAFCGYAGTGYSDALRDAFASMVRNEGFECAVYSEPEPPTNLAFIDDWPRRPKNKKALAAWLAALPPHTALFCPTDLRAFHAMRLLLDSGRSVPDDVAVLGVDNDPVICSCAEVAISSIDPNGLGVGYAAARLLDSAIDSPVSPKMRPVFHVHPGELYVRESTRNYPVKPEWFAAALAYAEEAIAKPLTPGILAQRAGVSQTALQNAFRGAFGMSAGNYILRLKMREAKRLVDAGELRVKEIAARLGFSSLAYFSHTYSRYFGRPPSGK